MLKFKFFTAIVCTLALVAASCSKTYAPSDAQTDTLPTEYEVGLSLGGEILDVTYSPLTKGDAASDSTLYVVSVWYTDSTRTPDISSDKYAHGVFDDISQCKLKVLTGKKYCIRVKAVLNGVKDVYHYRVADEADSCMFYKDQGRLTNKLYYYNTDKTDGDYYSNVQYGDHYDMTAYKHYYSYMHVYYGGCILNPSSSLSVLPIDMYFSGFKININANGLKDTDGEITWRLDYFADDGKFSSDSSSWTSGVRSLHYLEPMYDSVLSAREARAYVAFYAYYNITIDGINYPTTFANGTVIYFYRKKVTNITLNVDHRQITSNTKSFSLTMDDEDFNETTNDYSYDGTIME